MWPLALIVVLICAAAGILAVMVRDLRSGRSRLNGVAFSRAKVPVAFWTSIGLMAFFIGASLFGVAALLLG